MRLGALGWGASPLASPKGEAAWAGVEAAVSN
jgi:hypothetical protein